MARHFDVIIVGAGITGGALACALSSDMSNSSLNVAVVEAQSLKTKIPALNDPDGYCVDDFDVRVSALTIASQNLLDDVGVWPLIKERYLSPYECMHVWDAEGTGSIEFDAQDINQQALGHIIENRVTIAALTQKYSQQKNIEVIAPANVIALEQSDNTNILLLESGEKIAASLIVAADGANSNIRSMANIETREWDYHHQAIVCTVQTEKPHQQTAWQRFLPEGPLAFLPLHAGADNDYFCSIVWSAIPQYANHLMSLSESEFKNALGFAFEHQLGKIEVIGKRFSFPLRQRHAVDYVHPGLALIGDAAHVIHPLAGQGVNLGLMDVNVLAEEILRAEQRQLNVGDLSVLNRYQRRRKSENLTMMATMEGFKRLFAESTLPVRYFRNKGMSWLDKQSLLKNKLMRKAMGL